MNKSPEARNSPNNAEARPSEGRSGRWLRLKRLMAGSGILLLLGLATLGYYLFRPLAHKPLPADFHRYDLAQGSFVPLEPPPEAFAVGLSYAAHIEETASNFDPDGPPPVFRKHTRGFARTEGHATIPSTEDLCAAADGLEPGLGETLRQDHRQLPALLDYEGELGFVLLEDIDPGELMEPDFIAPIGFFITNDLSARTLAILGEGQTNRYDYWGASKGFPGFMPVPDQAWVPNDPKPNGIPSVVIETKINGEVRQSQSTDTMIYTPLQILHFIHAKYPESPLRKGTMVFTGTPGGVAMSTPRWLVRAVNLINMDRHKKLAIKLDGDRTRFLKPGDRVVVRAEGLGSVAVRISASGTPSQPE
jgi:2-keto-4-pentenoate hydratase/2-oxohepta-3-ene-1,7-dioic acid hydratase in catechol pathway